MLAAPDRGRGRQAADHRRLDLGAPARPETREPPTTSQFPNIPAPKVEGGQSDVGIAGVAAGRFDIGDSSRDPLSTDPHGLVFTKIARDGVCVITNNANPIANLSQRRSQGIFTRLDPRLERSRRREGLRPDRPVRPRRRLRYPGRLPEHLPGRRPEDLPERHAPRPPTASSRTPSPADKHAIGFVSFAYTAGVNAVAYQGVACNLRNAKSGQYGGVRNFWMVTKGAPKGEALKFIAWVTSGNKTTKSIINSNWIAVH